MNAPEPSSDRVGPLQRSLRETKPEIFAAYAMTGAIILLGGIGFLLDRRWHTAPWFLVVGLLAGIAVGFFALARGVRRTHID
jgi:F0F1-type ATP synthase assembly protein I